MKNKLIILASALFVAGSFLSGCQWQDKKMETSQENIQDAREDLADARMELKKSIAQFKFDSEKAIAANEKRIEGFKMKMGDMMGETKVNYNKQVMMLETKNTELKMKMADYKEDNNWQVFKTEFNHDMKELGKAFSDLTVNNVN